MTKQRNPNIDFGFHAVVPRLIRTGYDMLTPAQKWIYVCLKDLCGDDGTCYRALRTLAEETHVSTGLLSESIPTLHKVGLIHAEKKKRSSGGKEVWHITIVDIWQANAKAHPTKRSQREQSPSEERSQNEQTISTDDTDVQNVNQNVHKMNDDSQECSHCEQECSFCETEVITLSNNNIEAITERDITRVATASATPSPSFAEGEDDGTSTTHPTTYHHSVGSLDSMLPDHDLSGLTEDTHGITHPQPAAAEQPTSTVEIPQLNRLINPPSPLDENIPSTDESPRRIASETANDTASLPVVNAATDEVIHTDTRNTTNSYSPSSESKTPETEPATEQAEPPATGKGSGKRGGRGGKKATQPDMSPIAPPARPDESMPWGVEKCLAWADYARKQTFKPSNHPNSHYQKALVAAKSIIGRGIPENSFLTVFFNWMLGIDLNLKPLPDDALKSDSWDDYSVDLWVVSLHYEAEYKKYRKKKSDQKNDQTTLKEQREDIQRKAALDAASRAKKNDEFYEELRRTRREA